MPEAEKSVKCKKRPHTMINEKMNTKKIKYMQPTRITFHTKQLQSLTTNCFCKSRLDNLDFPMSISPNQSVLVNELKSKFEAVGERFDSLFERLKGNNLGNSSPKPVVSNSESQIIYNQISEVLEQWTGRHSQNYYELKHIFQSLNAFAKDQYQGDGLNLVLKRARMSWQPAKRLGTLFVSLLCLVISVILVSVSTHQKFHFGPPDHFGEVADWECEDQL